MSVINVILSGGVGSRLWPLSRKSRPKQYISLLGEMTLFQMCVARNRNVADKIQVIGSVDNYLLSRHDLEGCKVNEYSEVIEAAPRNTAAYIAFAAFLADKSDILLVTPSDHVITGTEKYETAIKEAIGLAAQDYIVTFGAIPSRAETGYGYIEHNTSFDVLSFREKPSAEKAKEYLESGKYLWNSGMFCFKAEIYLQELKRYAPNVYEAAYKAVQKMDGGFLPVKETMDIPAISVDYAVMEHSKIIKVIPFDFDWSDLGSFESLWEYLDKKEQQGIKNLVMGTRKHVEFVGLEQMILIETDDVILVMPKDKAQDVKKVYERLESENPDLLK